MLSAWMNVRMKPDVFQASGVSNKCRLNHSSGSLFFAFIREKQQIYRKTPAQKISIRKYANYKTLLNMRSLKAVKYI